MKTSELICDRCRKKFAGEKVDAEKVFICGLCSGNDIAGDPTRWRPSFPAAIDLSLEERSILVEALNAYVSFIEKDRPYLLKDERKIKETCMTLVAKIRINNGDRK
jgi:hypothetical protein